MTERCWLPRLFNNLGKAGGKVGGMFSLFLLPFRVCFFTGSETSEAGGWPCQEPGVTAPGEMVPAEREQV